MGSIRKVDKNLLHKFLSIFPHSLSGGGKRQPSLIGADPKLDAYRAVLQGALFVLALGLIAWGVQIIRSGQQFAWLDPAIREAMRPYGLANKDAVAVGIPLVLLGALLAGGLARGALPERLAGAGLPWPRLRRDFVAGVALVGGLLCHGLLYFHLLNRQYSHFDIGLFFFGLLLWGYVVYRLDPPRPAAPPGFTLYDLLSALALAALAIGLHTVELTRWNFAWIGDEGSFFGAAVDVGKADFPWNFFNLAFVYNAHPTLDSLYQGLVLKVAGADVWGWRMAEVGVVAITTALLYPLGTLLLGRVGATAACVALASSHYLMAFARVAYNNLHMIFWATLVMLLLALAWHTGRAVFVFATGVALGFCLYTFQLAAVTGPLVALTLLIPFVRRPTWGQVIAGGCCCLAWRWW
jgi:hypothetical protein